MRMSSNHFCLTLCFVLKKFVVVNEKVVLISTVFVTIKTAVAFVYYQN